MASDIHDRLKLEKGKYILLSAHREENIDTDLSYIDSIPRLHIEKNKQYKTNKHVFISVTE